MNVLFHIVSGVGIIATASHVRIENIKPKGILIGSCFVLGLLSHGILDYVPHCYPINSKVDAIVGLCLIILGTLFVSKEWRIIVLMTFVGCVLPDVIDLTPEILNSYLGANIPEIENLFPWHQKEYSGSIYSNNCMVSTINHILTLLFCGILVYLNWKSLIRILRTKL